jgi:hypothetical protein
MAKKGTVPNFALFRVQFGLDLNRIPDRIPHRRMAVHIIVQFFSEEISAHFKGFALTIAAAIRPDLALPIASNTMPM